MLYIRPVVLNKDMMIIGGNMRFEAAQVAGWTGVPVIIADTFTPEQEKEFTIKDNNSAGEWDYSALQNNWDADLLKQYGLDITATLGKTFSVQTFPAAPEPAIFQQPAETKSIPFAPVTEPGSIQTGVTQEQVDQKKNELDHAYENTRPKLIPVICPECLHEFSIAVKETQ